MMYNDLDNPDFDQTNVPIDINSNSMITHDSNSLFTVPKTIDSLPK